MNPIINMNHSQRYQDELKSEGLPPEEDINVLHARLAAECGDEYAREFGLLLSGQSYADKVMTYRLALARIATLDK